MHVLDKVCVVYDKKFKIHILLLIYYFYHQDWHKKNATHVFYILIYTE